MRIYQRIKLKRGIEKPIRARETVSMVNSEKPKVEQRQK
jgi:hypothetical protein